MDLKEELESTIGALQAGGIPFALCGGIAVTIHGAPRFTKDIDLLILPQDIDRAVAAAREIGFTLSSGPMTFGAGTTAERRIRRVSKPEGSQLLTLDFILVTAALQAAWDDRVLVEWQGREVAVVSRAGLITMKKLAGRPQDLLDIDALGQLDEEGEEH